MRPRITSAVLLMGFAMTATGGTSPAARMTVQVREGMLRITPSFLSKPSATLNYADTVDVLSSRNGWFQVRTLTAPVRTGWIHGSALTTKPLVLEAGERDADVAARSDEVALAGKGFNESVEASYREKHQELDFTWVDRMETFAAPPDQIRSFLADGGLIVEGGPK